MKLTALSGKACIFLTFPIRNDLKRDALSPLLFNFALDNAVRRVEINQEGWKLSNTHQLLVYADGVDILSRCVCSVEKNTEALVVTNKQTGLSVNADNTKYMVMF
jgi:hypothetical protein